MTVDPRFMTKRLSKLGNPDYLFDQNARRLMQGDRKKKSPGFWSLDFGTEFGTK